MNPSTQIQDGSSSYFQDQVMQPSEEELFLALKDEIKKDNEALERRLSNIEPNMEANKETKLDAKMMEDMNTNLTNLGRETGAMLDKIALHVEEIARAIKEQSSRQLPSNIKNDYIRESENATLSLDDELLNPTLKEDKDILYRDTIPLTLEQEFQVPSLVMKNELAKEEKLPWGERQVEEQHPWKTIDNVLVGIDKFNFPIDFLTFGVEVNQQVNERPSIATSQMWIDVEHGEMTLLVSKEKMKFNLHQSIPLTDGQKRTCMRIESSFLPFEEPTPDFLPEDAHEGFKF